MLLAVRRDVYLPIVTVVKQIFSSVVLNVVFRFKMSFVRLAYSLVDSGAIDLNYVTEPCESLASSFALQARRTYFLCC